MSSNTNPMPITSTTTTNVVQPVNVMQRYNFGAATPNTFMTLMPPNRFFGQICDKFTGNSDSIEVKSWLKIFELLTEGLSDSDRIKALARHLTEDALQWFALDDMSAEESWNAVRNAMNIRFTRVRAQGIAEASERRLKPHETVETYYNEMRRLLLNDRISDECQVKLLTKGMPEAYRIQIAALDPQSPQRWLRIAVGIEEAKRKRFTKHTDFSHYGQVNSPPDNSKSRQMVEKT